MIFVYRLLANIFYPLFIILIFFRTFFGKEDRKRYKEKILTSSFKPEKNKNKNLIWFHAASIGEVKSIFPLIKELNSNIKKIEILITTVTLSAGKIVEKKMNKYENIKHRYFPIDVNFLISNFLERWSPKLVVFVDSEVWPNLILEIKKRNISLALVNGRITKKSFKRWMYFSNFAKKIFNCFDLCLTSSKESEDNLKKLNAANVKFIGNIKFSGDLKIDNFNNKNLLNLKKSKVWCAASTHDGEELLCIKAHIRLKKSYSSLKTIIVPRHIDRSEKINKICIKHNLKSKIMNEHDAINVDDEIIIVNSFGKLNEFYYYSKSVFLGKSISKRFQNSGGQNPIEAAKLGCKIYHGPYVSNFAEIYSLLESYEISKQIISDEDLFKKLNEDFKIDKEINTGITDKINDLGKNILNSSVTELKRYII